MAVHKFSGKEYETVLNDGLNELGMSLNEVLVTSTEVKAGLFKGTNVEVTITPLTDVLEYAKEFLSDTIQNMGLEVRFETQLRDNMNSYERLIVHNAVAEFKDVYTVSVGEEPNRHVIIKPKEEQ